MAPVTWWVFSQGSPPGGRFFYQKILEPGNRGGVLFPSTATPDGIFWAGFSIAPSTCIPSTGRLPVVYW